MIVPPLVRAMSFCSRQRDFISAVLVVIRDFERRDDGRIVAGTRDG